MAVNSVEVTRYLALTRRLDGLAQVSVRQSIALHLQLAGLRRQRIWGQITAEQFLDQIHGLAGAIELVEAENGAAGVFDRAGDLPVISSQD